MTVREQAEVILREHQWLHFSSKCLCGFKEHLRGEHAAHVAAELEKAGLLNPLRAEANAIREASDGDD